jgi:hypothetical protein
MAWTRDPISMCIRVNREGMMLLEMHIETVFRLVYGNDTHCCWPPFRVLENKECCIRSLNSLNSDLKLQIDEPWDVPIKHFILLS